MLYMEMKQEKVKWKYCNERKQIPQNFAVLISCEWKCRQYHTKTRAHNSI